MEKLWKRAERRIAEILGGRRIPVAGRAGSPDVVTEKFAIEVKTRKKLPEWLKVEKPVILNDKYILLPLKDFLELYQSG